MFRSTLCALSMLALSSAFVTATPISLGSLAAYGALTSNAQLHNNYYSSGNTTTINNGLNAGSLYAFAGPDAIVYNGGGSFQTITFNGSEYTDFHALTTTLGGLGGTPIASWAGLTPGNYTFTSAPTSVTLTTPGTYVFSYTGGTPLAFNGATITLGSGVSSDDVFWYVPQDVNVTNSTFGGVLVVDGYGVSLEANGAPLVFNGRVLAEGAINLTAWNGGNMSMNTQAADPGPEVPEPSTFVLVVPALALGAIVRRRLARR
jgi:hypothetical protein